MLRLITIIVIGISLNYWIDALTDSEDLSRLYQAEDPLLDQQQAQTTSVICQLNGNKKDVFLVNVLKDRYEFSSGRISIRETIDTTFIGSISVDIDCYQSLQPLIKDMVKKEAKISLFSSIQP